MRRQLCVHAWPELDNSDRATSICKYAPISEGSSWFQARPSLSPNVNARAPRLLRRVSCTAFGASPCTASLSYYNHKDARTFFANVARCLLSDLSAQKLE